jgi:FixJ family two-component response regulator
MSVPSPRITIIEDDESVRRALCRWLKSLGLNAETFATAEEFLEDFNRELTLPARQVLGDLGRCLVLDVNLPGLSGLELQDRLKAERRELPIIFITAYQDERAQERALQTGAVAFLYKPFDEQTLLAAVRKGLAQKRTMDG